jgi:hypothetical protein
MFLLNIQKKAELGAGNRMLMGISYIGSLLKERFRKVNSYERWGQEEDRDNYE